MSKPKLLIIGHARHGKDTAAEYLATQYGFTFRSSSQMAAEIFIFDSLRTKYGYQTFEECYEDRMNHRAEWYRLIRSYNYPDKTRLAQKIMERADIYVGMRDRDEIEACREKKIFDYIIWIDAHQRLPQEPPDSFNIDISLSDYIVNNNLTEGHMRFGLDSLIFEISMQWIAEKSYCF